MNDMNEEERLIELCQAAAIKINAVINDLERAHPHGPWSLLVNWVADAMIASPVGPDQYLDYLIESAREVHSRKITNALLESSVATRH